MSKKVILITGTSSGIGRALVKALSHENYIIYGTCRDTTTIDPADHKEGYHLLNLDMGNQQAINQIVDTIVTQQGRIDILINNAGQGISGPFEEIPNDHIQSCFQVNYFGPVQLTQKVLPIMRKQKNGLVINITSVAGYMGLPFRSAYSASKAALDITTESIRMELSGTGVNVINIAPGEVATDIASRRYTSPVVTDSFYQHKYGVALEKMNADVSKGMTPNEAAQKIIRIIEQPKKVRYIAGRFLETIAVTLKALLPSKTFELIMKSFYKI